MDEREEANLIESTHVCRVDSILEVLKQQAILLHNHSATVEDTKLKIKLSHQIDCMAGCFHLLSEHRN